MLPKAIFTWLKLQKTVILWNITISNNCSILTYFKYEINKNHWSSLQCHMILKIHMNILQWLFGAQETLFRF